MPTAWYPHWRHRFDRYSRKDRLHAWWRERFGNQGMRGRKVGIVALARKLVIALWRFVEDGIVPEGATLKARPTI